MSFINVDLDELFCFAAGLNNKMQGVAGLPRGDELLFPCMIDQGLQIFAAFDVGSLGPFD